MKNDLKELNLPGLATAYQTKYKELLAEAIEKETAIELFRWNRLKKDMLARLDVGESSEGLEEGIIEVIGDPKSPQVDREAIKQAAVKFVTTHFIEAAQLSKCLSWLPSQLYAYFGSWRAVQVGDKYCPEATVHKNVAEQQDLYALGAILLAKAPRTELFKGASKEYRQYKHPFNPLTPIPLVGFKQFQDINYMDWDLTKIGALENQDFADLIGVDYPKLGQAELLELRARATTTLSGPKAGIQGNPVSCASRFHLAETSLGKVPKLAQTMYIQTWCAHPSNRTKYMVLDPEDWDNVPAPLISDDLFTPLAKTEPKRPKVTPEYTTDLPWD